MKIRKWLVRVGLVIAIASLIVMFTFTQVSHEASFCMMIGLLIFSIGVNFYLKD